MIKWIKNLIEKRKKNRARIKRQKDLNVNVEITDIFLTEGSCFVVYFTMDEYIKSEFRRAYPTAWLGMSAFKKRECISKEIMVFFEDFYRYSEGLSETKFDIQYSEKTRHILNSIKPTTKEE